MPIKGELKGDLIALAKAGLFDVIIHGCNCFNNMGSGIAKQIKKEFPEAWQADQETEKGSRDKLGDWTVAQYPEHQEYPDLIVINLYTQFDYGYDGKDRLDYEALEYGFRWIDEYYEGNVGIPLIGCGLAGGDWSKVKEIINRVTPDLNIFVVHYEEIKS